MSEYKKHVIILGAGASATSGYPLADDLRLLVSSRPHLQERLAKLGLAVGSSESSGVLNWVFDGNRKTIMELFRHGGFSTVDEFSYLSRSRFQTEIQGLKTVVRLALALHNPEDNFHKSDYNFFIQKLFQKNLFPLRDDITVLTFNYDPYLMYLLQKAYSIRSETASYAVSGQVLKCITSGFHGRQLAHAEILNEMCLLHLHGIISWPEVALQGKDISHNDLFESSIVARLKKLCDHHPCCPILFPWEILDDSGQFIESSRFCLQERVSGNGHRWGGYAGAVDIHELFVSVWKRAQSEINAATKISFVGLSMHDFLLHGFKFLFRNKSTPAELVVVNKELENFRHEKAHLLYKLPRTPQYKVREMLLKTAQHQGEFMESRFDSFRAYETFAEFILKEMD